MSKNLNLIFEEFFSVPRGKRKSNFGKYIHGYKEADFKKKIQTLLDQYYETHGSFDFDNEIYAAVTKDVVSHYSNNKDAFIEVLKAYNKVLIEKFELPIRIPYPPIPVSNTFERLMFIAKYLQDDSHRIGDLSDILWVSDRTIEADLAKLQGNDDDPLQVCGKRFVIDEMDRSMGRMTFGSTAHPFFLTGNLTQVIVMLEGLREMSKRPEYKGYAMPMAIDIWNQLSEYGKNRITFVSKNLMKLDWEWYESLNRDEKDLYWTERACSSEGSSALLYSMKSEKKCVVEYETDNGIVFYENVRFIKYTEDGFEVEIDGTRKVLEEKRILRSSTRKEDMF